MKYSLPASSIMDMRVSVILYSLAGTFKPLPLGAAAAAAAVAAAEAAARTKSPAFVPVCSPWPAHGQPMAFCWPGGEPASES